MMADASRDIRTLTAGDDATGQRLDSYLGSRFPDLSRNRIQAALAAGRVEVDGRPRPKSHRLRGGERIVLAPLPAQPLTAAPQEIPLDVVYEDDQVAVVAKPAGLVVHPAPGHPDGTLVNALAHRYGALAGGAPLRPGIVHRLDRDTSGLLVVALTPEAHAALVAQLQERTLDRRYSALSWGRWDAASGELTGAIGRHPRDRRRMAVVRRGGRPARTRYEVGEDFGFCQLCAVALDTGRTHQIRVHFARAGHPVVGDPLYGDDRRARNVAPDERAAAARLARAARRQLLHAGELSFRHPVSGERLRFRSALPPDFAEALAALRRGA
jgi:23S rRNA pseudouridine1911/1915/1917 synthase